MTTEDRIIAALGALILAVGLGYYLAWFAMWLVGS